MGPDDEIWELLLTADQATALADALDSVIEGENAEAFSEIEREALARVLEQVRSDLTVEGAP